MLGERAHADAQATQKYHRFPTTLHEVMDSVLSEAERTQRWKASAILRCLARRWRVVRVAWSHVQTGLYDSYIDSLCEDVARNTCSSSRLESVYLYLVHQRVRQVFAMLDQWWVRYAKHGIAKAPLPTGKKNARRVGEDEACISSDSEWEPTDDDESTTSEDASSDGNDSCDITLTRTHKHSYDLRPRPTLRTTPA